MHEPIWPSGSTAHSPDTNTEGPLGWKGRGACRDEDPDLFFVEGRGNLAAIQTAKQLCADACEVIDTCREYAIEFNIAHGVWGGMSTHQRNEERQRRRDAEEGRQRFA